MEQAREEDDQKKKIIFFDALYALDEADRQQEEEEKKEPNEIVRLLTESKQRNQVKTSTGPEGTVNAHGGSREIHSVKGTRLRMSTVPDTTASSVEWLSSRRVDPRLERTSLLPRKSAIRGEEREQLNQEPLRTSVTTIPTPTPIPTHLHPRRTSSLNRHIPTMPGKRKRVQSLQIRPESQQIFKGLSFCMYRTYI